MATNINTILNWYKTGLKPTQAQFWASWQSFWHKGEQIPQSSISGLETVLNAKTENDQFNAHKTDAGAHAGLFDLKEDLANKGAANGYAPLNEFIKISSEYLSIVDDLVTGGSTALLSAEQGKVLNTQINAINTLLTSNDVNLDTIQEIVDAIKTVQTSLETILVNDLTSGGTTKALTAEMGKTLKGLIDGLNLQQVLDAGNTAEYDSGTSNIALMAGVDNDRFNQIIIADEFENSSIFQNKNSVSLSSENDSYSASVGVSGGSANISQRDKVNNTTSRIAFPSYQPVDNIFELPAKTISGTFILATKDDIPVIEPSQITISTSISITTDTLDSNSYSQKGKNVIIDNGVNAINITVNGGTDFCSSYLKHGTGAITFVQGAGRTLALVDGTEVLNGAVGSTATISSVGTKDYLRISNA